MAKLWVVKNTTRRKRMMMMMKHTTIAILLPPLNNNHKCNKGVVYSLRAEPSHSMFACLKAQTMTMFQRRTLTINHRHNNLNHHHLKKRKRSKCQRMETFSGMLHRRCEEEDDTVHTRTTDHHHHQVFVHANSCAIVLNLFCEIWSSDKYTTLLLHTHTHVSDRTSRES